MGVRFRSFAKKRWKLLGALTSLLTVGGGSFVVTDRLVSLIVDRLRPDLEKQLSKPLGHPIKIGPYRGLRLWGLAIGQTEIFSGPLDESSAKFLGGKIGFAPLASFLHWRPVVEIKLNGADFRFRRNKNGSYWVPGNLNGDSSPRFDFRFSFLDPVKVHLEPSALTLLASAKGQVHFGIRRVGGMVRLKFPDSGSLFLQGQGSWDKYDFHANTRLKDVDLESLQELFSAIPLTTKGRLDGDFGFHIKNGRLNCLGELNLDGFKIKTFNLKQPVSSPKTSLNCAKDRVNFPKSNWQYGPLIGSFGGDFLFESSPKRFGGGSGLLRVNYFGNDDQKLKAVLPIAVRREGLEIGELEAVLDLKSLPLARVGQVIGVPIGGTLTTRGRINGPLRSLEPDISLRLENPEVSSIRLQEDWRGKFLSENSKGSSLHMTPVGDVIPAKLSATFTPQLRLRNVIARRSDGSFSLIRDAEDGSYSWKADRLKLDGVEFALPPQKRYERIFGELTGDGIFNLQKKSVEGKVRLSSPRTMGLDLREASLEGSVVDNYYSLQGSMLPPDIGEVVINASGRLGGRLHAKAKARGVSARWLTVSALQLPKISLRTTPSNGDAKDLGTFITKSFGSSVNDQLKGVLASKDFLRKADESSKKKILNPQDLRGKLDADFDLKGPNLSKLSLALKIEGNVWADGQGESSLNDVKPFVAKLNGPLEGGEGTFSLLNIPFSLLSLVAPIPSGLNGGLGLSGTYRRKKEDLELSADLMLEQAKLGSNYLVIERGKLGFSKSILDLDISLRSSSSSEPINLIGKVPINASLPMNLRLESHGDGLNFLASLSNGSAFWNSGDSHLKLLITGTFNNPNANGYLVIENADFVYNDQLITDVNTSMIFDFNRLEFQDLQAKIGTNGIVSGKGAIALIKPSIERQPLELNIDQTRLRLPVADVEISGNIVLTRSLLKPTFGGQLTIQKGSISPGKSGLVGKTVNANVDDKQELEKTSEQNIYSSRLLEEQKWDFEKPLVLLGRDVEPNASKMLRSSIPNVESLSFDNLRLRLGSDLRILSQPLANFGTEGFLTLNGSLGPSLQPRGVVKLLSGRVNLFTTTFNLDRKAANVAVFTPSLGLIPYVDVSLTSRVAESVSESNNFQSSNVFAKNGTGPFGVGGFRLVRVMVQATGPADRIAENIQLRSSPPMPRAQLLGLIGGNTLAGLTGGGDNEMIASVLGRSLLSPVLGTISDSFSDRLQLSLYPTYVNAEDNEEAGDVKATSQEDTPVEAPPEQAWVTEIGIDITERFNFSVLATPNRKDIPPQGTLSYQVTPNLGLAGSLDKEGAWQSQLQLFFRF
ncbi:translocation/assembly module TamB domain-containing protein [Prochlorococcus sp. MIT 1341]|uniref:translocation/assembly module TamB domain-containing protein n=1 Tax=Prochlorococcus sp. MIT 1341 TaxID=3096221 RepID=UPI002A755FA1|nr:translocation/assembly module TamB domain-containing protein [Prochlorococcus sp. MIT 1341]